MIHFWLRVPGFHDVNSLDNRDPKVLERFADVAGPILWKWFRPRVRGLENIPDGGALYVCNHSGGFMTPDTWILAVALTRERGTDDVPYALAHQVVMEAPLTNQLLPAMGAIAANPENAHRVFAAGRKVLVYPGGDLDAFRPHVTGVASFLVLAVVTCGSRFVRECLSSRLSLPVLTTSGGS